jgi:uncharacterized SAM-binding protein YcdF (DUF218 family)
MRRLFSAKFLWFLVALAAIAYFAMTYWSVARQAYIDETRPSEAIVVFGAAEYYGKPSPVFKARLDHALNLFNRGVAPLVITTGGSKDPKFSEGAVGRDYLVAAGVPETSVIAETQSSDTADSAERVASILRKNGKSTCVAVSDGYHMFRIKQMMARQGITAYGAPRAQQVPLTARQRAANYIKEVLSLTLWRLHIT